MSKAVLFGALTALTARNRREARETDPRPTATREEPRARTTETREAREETRDDRPREDDPRANQDEDPRAVEETRDSAEQHAEEEDGPPPCVMDCHLGFDFESPDSTCNALTGWKDTACLDDCEDWVLHEIEHYRNAACAGDWPVDEEHRHEEEAIEEDFEHPEQHHEPPPECLNTCPGYPFERENWEALEINPDDGEQMCKFIEEALPCTESCDQFIKDFVVSMKDDACSGNWPAHEVEHEEEFEEDLATQGHDEAINCVENCIEPCWHPTWQTCWDGLWQDCWDPTWDACWAANEDHEICHEQTMETCEETTVEDCKAEVIDICLPQCMEECGLA